MNEKVLADLERARLASSALDPATDQLNETVALIQQALVNLHLGVSAKVEIRPGSFLAFGKLGHVWRLLHVTETEELPLQNSNREIRLLAVDKLPELVSKLADEAERLQDELKEKREQAQAFLAQLKKGVR